MGKIRLEKLELHEKGAKAWRIIEEPDQPALNIKWEPATVDMLLEVKDRFTRRAIREEFIKTIRQEFNGSAGPKFVTFDQDRKGFVTPVLNGHYSVAWYLDREQNTANVSAIMPLASDLSETSPAQLKKYVKQATKPESGRKILNP